MILLFWEFCIFMEDNPSGLQNQNPLGIMELSVNFGQEPAKSFTALNRAFMLACQAGSRKKQDVALPLMIALLMIMFHILVEDMTQGVFAKQNQPRETLLLHGSDPALRVGIEVGRPRW